MTPRYSLCCKSPYKVNGKITKFYVCLKCENACDVGYIKGTKQLSNCCKAGIELTGSPNHEDGFACIKCKRIIGTPLTPKQQDDKIFELTQKIYSKFSFFDYGIRVLFLIHRNKEGGGTNNTKVLKVISYPKEDDKTNLFDRIYSLVEEKERRPEELRIYMSLNARDINKATRQLKQNMLDNDYNKGAVHEDFYLHLWARWISALMKPSSRAETMFLFDCDNSEEIKEFQNELYEAEKKLEKSLILFSYDTKSGRHIITKPFDPALVPNAKEKMNKDGLLLLDF